MVSIPMLGAFSPVGLHWIAPPGPSNSSHSKSMRLLKYSMVHIVGRVVQTSSMPLVFFAFQVLLLGQNPAPLVFAQAPSSSWSS